jgi:hypothetical protein
MANAPEHTVKVGGIQLSIWNNETSKGTFQSITIDKSYKSGEEWKRTKSFKPTDLVKLQLGITEVLKYLYIKNIIEPACEQDATQVAPKDF